MKHKIQILPFVVLILLWSSFSQAAIQSDDHWAVSGRLNAYYKVIDVHSHAGTHSKREGDTHSAELNLNLAGPWGRGLAGIETRSRLTNDRKIQRDRAELLYFRSFYKDKIWNMELGDVALSLNNYVFGGSVKGVKLEYTSDKKSRTWNYAAIVGFKRPAWRELYRQEDEETPTGYSGAFEIEYVHERSKEIAFSGSILDTDMDTGHLESATGARGYGFGLSGKWRFNKYITLRGRGAVSNGETDVTTNDDTGTNTALYLKLLTRPILKTVKSNFIYQRIDTDFVSFGGSANSDKEQIENITSWRISRTLRARFDLKARRDNLDGSLGATQDNYYEMATLTYSPDFLDRGDFNFVVSNRDIDGRGADNRRVNASADVKVRKKSGWQYGGGYQYSDYEDSVLSSASQTTHTLRALLGFRKKLSDVSSYRFTIRPDYQNIEDEQNKIGLNLDAGYVFNKHWSLDLLYLRNQIDQDEGNDSRNSTYQFRTTYKIDEAGKNLLRLRLEKRTVSTDNDLANRYNEYIGQLSLVSNF